MEHPYRFPISAGLAVFLLLLSTSVLAQITVTQSDLQTAFAVGNKYSSFGDTTHATIFVGAPSSSAQTWDFRGRPYSFAGTGQSITPSTAPSISRFPNANLVLNEVDIAGTDTITGQSYYRLSSTGLDYFGFGSGPNVTAYSPPMPALKLPCTMGTKWSYKSDTTWYVQGFLGIVSISNYTVDAFGTLILPTGSYQALRMVHESITMNVGLFPSQSRSYTYSFETKTLFSASVSVDSAEYGKATVVPRSVYYNIAGATGVEQSRIGAVPEQFALEQNYPNPFNPVTNIRYNIAHSNYVTLKVFDLLGREVATLVNESQAPGFYTVDFDAGSLASGVYVYRLEAGGFVEMKKMMVLR